MNHAALISKLQYYNIGGSLLNWFSSYLHGRQQRVTALGATSSTKTVGSGVPQGSILGPTLFLLYVNDLPDIIENSSVASFADDTKIFRCIDSTNDTASLQADLQNLDSWSCGAEISNIITRRTLYLSVVRPVLGYGTQVWCPQSISLVRRTERIQRRASKFILKLPYMCTCRDIQRETNYFDANASFILA